MKASRNGVAMKKIIDRIKEVTTGRSVKSVAEEIGLPQTSLNAYMTGRHKITIELIKQISATFGVSADWLLGLSDDRGGASSVGSDVEKAQMANKIHELEIKVATLENALSLVGGRRVPSVKTGGGIVTKTA
jgi:plasmid maintenance system antidote protein VapI